MAVLDYSAKRSVGFLKWLEKLAEWLERKDHQASILDGNGATEERRAKAENDVGNGSREEGGDDRGEEGQTRMVDWEERLRFEKIREVGEKRPTSFHILLLVGSPLVTRPL